MSQPIRFYHRGALRSVQGVPHDRSVLDWLRDDQRACGTKEGCNEGDCGACTVVVGEPADGGLRLAPVNSCIRPLASLHGHALWTVEDLASDAGTLHPCQQAMVEQHGSQCGFCTPGFVMSLWALYQQHAHYPGRDAVEQALAGNLCRCTGYRPIVDAARAMYERPWAPHDTAAAASALAAVDAHEDLRYAHDGALFEAPASLPRLLALRHEAPQACLVAGNTDVGLWVNKQHREIAHFIALGRVPELRTLDARDGVLHIGATVSLEDAYAALARHWPAWAALQARFASLPIRRIGTLGGNVANGSPIGDSMPGLLALDARVLLGSVHGERELPLDAFYLGYQKRAMQPDEVLLAVRVPLPAARAGEVSHFATDKLSKRLDQDISAVCSALHVRVQGDVMVDCRIAFGGMAATPARAPQAEAALRGQPLGRAAFDAAARALVHDYTPLSDLRASAGYRLQGAQGLLLRALTALDARVRGTPQPVTLAQLADGVARDDLAAEARA
ncbi:MAG: xanthine dehydrogenase small subunit [Betaproteobacteria bacterium]|nr:xanthine dehydrogenase small subunit [Betaproteobacteria bacterium]MDE2048061.1 xanthine dehydrogenase small subunit [Betaproteobacteria bacterium]